MFVLLCVCLQAIVVTSQPTKYIIYESCSEYITAFTAFRQEIPGCMTREELTGIQNAADSIPVWGHCNSKSFFTWFLNPDEDALTRSSSELVGVIPVHSLFLLCDVINTNDPWRRAVSKVLLMNVMETCSNKTLSGSDVDNDMNEIDYAPYAWSVGMDVIRAGMQDCLDIRCSSSNSTSLSPQPISSGCTTTSTTSSTTTRSSSTITATSTTTATTTTSSSTIITTTTIIPISG